MAMTIADLIAIPDLKFTLLTEQVPLTAAVTWVAVSELSDPSPWLSGGELLLTTGMRLGSEQLACQKYVDTLHSANVSVLGFGIGLSHDRVPDTLVAAAERAGIAVLEVPEPLPFVAISRAVSTWLADRENQAQLASFRAQADLIRGALSKPGDVQGLLEILATHLRGFAIVTMTDGRPDIAAPPESLETVDRFSDAIERIRPRGLLGSFAMASPGEHVVILPLGAAGRAVGFLITGGPQAITAVDQAVLNLAVSLISWDAVRPANTAAHLQELQSMVIALAQHVDVPASLWHGIGMADRVVAVQVRTRQSSQSSDLLERFSRMPASIWQLDAGGVHGLVSHAGVEELSRFLGHEVAIGVSEPIRADSAVAVRAALAHARHAVDQATEGSGVCSYEEVTDQSLSGLIEADRLVQWSAAYLKSIHASAEGADLLQTLRAWLTCHGHLDATGSLLCIHRHTVRHRLKRAETLLGRPLDDPTVRSDLWVALSVSDHP